MPDVPVFYFISSWVIDASTICSFIHVVRVELLLWFIKYSNTLYNTVEHAEKSNLSWKVLKRVEMESSLNFLKSYTCVLNLCNLQLPWHNFTCIWLPKHFVSNLSYRSAELFSDCGVWDIRITVTNIIATPQYLFIIYLFTNRTWCNETTYWRNKQADDAVHIGSVSI